MSLPQLSDSPFALLFAGQGAQKVGMGADLPEMQELLKEADEILGRSLSKVVLEGPEEDLTRTGNCQPALYVHGLACLKAVQRVTSNRLNFQAAAGLSLGEFTAHCAAGTFDFATGLKVVARRGELMEQACEKYPGTMTALIGGELEAIENLAQEADVDIANLNTPGQVVLSGTLEGIQKAAEIAANFGVRKVIPLTVAGAYHSRLMQSAQDELAEVLASIDLQMPRVPVPSNSLGQPATNVEEIRQSLVKQVTGTVRWTENIEGMLAFGMTHFLELGPGKVLTGMVGRIRKGTPCVAVEDAESLAQLTTA
ncbi:MAG: ACP S-malonyltransferase [Verrucomicrobiales bacterium]